MCSGLGLHSPAVGTPMCLVHERLFALELDQNVVMSMKQGWTLQRFAIIHMQNNLNVSSRRIFYAYSDFLLLL